MLQENARLEGLTVDLEVAGEPSEDVQVADDRRPGVERFETEEVRVDGERDSSDGDIASVRLRRNYESRP